MRIFVAGASGVIGVRLVPLLVSAGHKVAGMTRAPEKAGLLAELGAEPIVCDVYDREALAKAVGGFKPNVVINELTDLPDTAQTINEANKRMRREGNRNLLEAAQTAGVRQFIAQSVAWRLPGDAGAAVDELERAVLDANGVVVRYGRLYGPGTYYPNEKPEPPRVYVDEAARRTVPAIDATRSVIEITEE
jgi:nucleoside-diphosphate-sugar epimerase